MVSASQIVINLQDNRRRIEEIQNGLNEPDLVTDSQNFQEAYDALREPLLKVTKFMDLIISYDPDKVEKEPGKSTMVQFCCDRIQQNLFLARTFIDKMKTTEVIPTTENLVINFSQAFESLQDLTAIYLSEIEEDHLSYEKLANVPVEETVYLAPEAFMKGIYTNNLILFLEAFVALDSKARYNVYQSEGAADMLEKAFQDFTFLAAQVQDQAVLVKQDLDELKQNDDYDPERIPYIEKLRQDISSLLGYDYHCPNLVANIRNTGMCTYQDLTNTLLTTAAYNPSSIDYPKLMKTLFVLMQAARYESQEDSSLEALSKEKLLHFGERRSRAQRKIFFMALSNCKQYISMVEPGEFSLDELEDITPNAHIVQKIANADIKLTIDQVQKEFLIPVEAGKDLEKDSEVAKFFDEYKEFFNGVCVTIADLQNLAWYPDNKELNKLINSITKRVQEDRNQDYTKAAQLIYILSRVYAKIPIPENHLKIYYQTLAEQQEFLKNPALEKFLKEHNLIELDDFIARMKKKKNDSE